METITTTETENANFTVAIAIDAKSAAIVGVAMFLAILIALIIYKKI